MKLRIDRTQRLGVVEDLPYAKAIRDSELRELVYDAWAMSLSSSGFDRINDMPCSAGPGGPELKGSGQAAHLSGVARIGVSIAQGLTDEVGHFRVDLDEVIAGGLCHDLGKAWEYDPDNISRGGATIGSRARRPCATRCSGSSSHLRPVCLSRSPTSPALTRPKGSTSRGASPGR